MANPLQENSIPLKADAPAPHAPLLCPHCKAVYDAIEGIEGKRVKCKVCGHVWRADTHAAAKITGALGEALSSPSIGTTLLAAGDHASTVGHLVTHTAREPRPPAGEWIGKQLGKYEIKAILGQGAMGYVYEAMDTELRRTVALKVLPGRTDQRETLGHKLFMQEARTAARLGHPNIVTIFDVGQENGTYFLAMELIDGLTLMSLVKQRGALPVEQACYIIALAARALAAGHAQGVVHRDVKPGNILVANSGLVKLTDFGLALAADTEDMTNLHGVAFGTPGWISPEVARGETATPASDIYGLGLSLHYALTGKRLVKAKTKSGMIQLQREAKSIRLEELPAEWPQPLRNVLTKCLAADPAERVDAESLAKALMRVSAVVGAGSRDGDVEEAKTVDIGSRGSGWGIFVTILVLLVAAGYWGWRWVS